MKENENGSVDAQLDAATISQLTWKPSVKRDIAVKILGHMVGNNDRIVWPDEIDFTSIAKDDRNCIGTTWRTLAKMDMIKRMDGHRRSTSEESRGRTIFSYRLTNEALARAFLRRNGVVNIKRGQPELPL